MNETCFISIVVVSRVKIVTVKKMFNYRMVKEQL